MNATERMKEKLDAVGGMYPEQHERLSKCADVVLEHGAEQLHKAFEKQLDQIARTQTPEEAKRKVDKMEHAIFESSLLSPFLGARDSNGRSRLWITVVVVTLLVLALVISMLTELARVF